MCLTVPAKIVKIEKNKAKVIQAGNNREIDISLLPSLKSGDYILEQAGLAIKKISSKEAKKLFNLLKNKRR